MQDFYHQLRKAELHLHLEGSVEPETILELDPSLDLASIRRKYEYNDFAGFLQSYIWVNKLLKTPAHYALITRRLLESLTAQNVVYAEITLSAGVILWKEQDFDSIFTAIREEAAKSSVDTRWILDAIRQFGPDPAQKVLELAIRNKENDVVAFGIGGDEERGPANWFKNIFSHAAANGLRLVPHAGEIPSPASIWQTLELSPDRIGHGIAAAQDEHLMRHLRDQNIPLEVCITSNVRTGVVDSLAVHPVRKLYDAGVPITLNTDDPGLFGTTLVNEFRIASEHFGFSDEELRGIAEDSFRYAAKP